MSVLGQKQTLERFSPSEINLKSEVPAPLSLAPIPLAFGIRTEIGEVTRFGEDRPKSSLFDMIAPGLADMRGERLRWLGNPPAHRFREIYNHKM